MKMIKVGMLLRCKWSFAGAPIKYALGVLGSKISDLDHYFPFVYSNII